METEYRYCYVPEIQMSFDGGDHISSGKRWSTGHIYFIDRLLDAAGIFCGAEIKSDSKQGVLVSNRKTRVQGVPICDECQELYLQSDAPEIRKLKAWSE